MRSSAEVNTGSAKISALIQEAARPYVIHVLSTSYSASRAILGRRLFRVELKSRVGVLWWALNKSTAGLGVSQALQKW